jgi:UDP-N-acetylglucosamine 1-carboxyvinyltransferase
MDAFLIEGPTRISGEVDAAGSKNAALPILAGCLLTEEECLLENVPDLADIRTMLHLLEMLGRRSERDGGTVRILPGKVTCHEAPYELVRTMRASISVLGPLVGKEGRARVSFPGGCAIGPRPIDLHIKGLEALGAEIEVHHGYLDAKASRLRGAQIYLAGASGSSVLATDNVMMAAVLADGETVIEGAALEPEVVDACHFLQAMGAKIEGIGTSVLRITGVQELHGCRYRVIPDRIESGSLLAAAAITGGSLLVRGARADHMGRILDLFIESGATVETGPDGVRLTAGSRIRPVEVETKPYPEYPTDMQAQLMALLSLGEGLSAITEKIYPDRFIHVPEFNRMGADIKMEGATAIIKGVPRLEGAPVMSSDLRAGAALVIAALAAEGESRVRRIYHVDRGYERFEEKLQSVGARIRRVTE